MHTDGYIKLGYGETSIEFLRSKPIDEVRETLLSFKGIGPKCAACLMSFSMDLPEFAVVSLGCDIIDVGFGFKYRVLRMI